MWGWWFFLSAVDETEVWEQQKEGLHVFLECVHLSLYKHEGFLVIDRWTKRKKMSDKARRDRDLMAREQHTKGGKGGNHDYHHY